MSADAAPAAAAPAPAPAREERPNSDTTIYLANLPLTVTTATLRQWCEDNFEEQPSKVQVRKPMPRRGQKATAKYGHLSFESADMAAGTLSLLQDDETFEIEGAPIEASWAKVRIERPKSSKTKKSRKKGKKAAAPVEEDLAAGRRVYTRNFGTEEELRATLGEYGEIESVTLKEARRDKTPFAHVVFAEEASATAAIEANATPEGEEAAEGALVVELAKAPRRAAPAAAAGGGGGGAAGGAEGGGGGKGRARRPPRDDRNLLPEPSKNQLSCRNLPWDMDEDALGALFADYSSVTEVQVVRRKFDNRSRGYGFVRFSDEAEAAAAIEALAGRDIGADSKGNTLNLKVDFAKCAPYPAEAAAADAGDAN